MILMDTHYDKPVGSGMNLLVLDFQNVSCNPDAARFVLYKMSWDVLPKYSSSGNTSSFGILN